MSTSANTAAPIDIHTLSAIQQFYRLQVRITPAADGWGASPEDRALLFDIQPVVEDDRQAAEWALSPGDGRDLGQQGIFAAFYLDCVVDATMVVVVTAALLSSPGGQERLGSAAGIRINERQVGVAQ
jgi:hypothetical protein